MKPSHVKEAAVGVAEDVEDLVEEEDEVVADTVVAATEVDAVDMAVVVRHHFAVFLSMNIG